MNRFGFLSAALSLLLSACPPAEEERPLPFPGFDSSLLVDENGLVTPLVCPGSVGCEEASDTFRAGAAARAITPTLETWEDLDGNGLQHGDEPFVDENGNGRWDPVWLAGFGQGRAATEIHDDNWARALVLEKGDVRVGLVVLDLIGLFQPDVLRIREKAREAGLDLDHLLVTTTHQHEGADTMGLWGPDPATSGYDPAYGDLVVSRSVEALSEAAFGLRSARLEAAQGEAPSVVNDTRLPIVIDPVVTVVVFLDTSTGEAFASLTIFGDHPEALGSRNTAVTSDYPHYVRERMEAELPGSVALFASGALGGLMTTIGIDGCPDAEGNDTCPQGTFERAEHVGSQVASTAIAALAGGGAIVDDDPELRVLRYPVLLPATNPKFAYGLKLGILWRHMHDAEQRPIPPEALVEASIDELASGDLSVGTEVGALRIGPVEIAAVPGELYPELWLVKEDGSSYIERPENADFSDAEPETPVMASMPDAPLRAILNNANDALGYIIPKTQFDMESPFAYDPKGQYGEENSVGEHAGPRITGAVAEMYGLLK